MKIPLDKHDGKKRTLEVPVISEEELREIEKMFKEDDEVIAAEREQKKEQQALDKEVSDRDKSANQHDPIDKIPIHIPKSEQKESLVVFDPANEQKYQKLFSRLKQ